MNKKAKSYMYLLLCLIIFLAYFNKADNVLAAESSYIILSHYHKSMNIGDKLYLGAYTSTGKLPSFKSSNTKIVSVDRYGIVKAKKSGTAAVTAKIKNSTASCIITVKPTVIKLNTTEISIEHNQSFRLNAYTSNGASVKWKTGKKSVASVDNNGNIVGQKPGTTTVTASADGCQAVCKVTVKKPVITISKEHLSLWRTQKANLTVTVSSGISPKWRSSRSSVASVDDNGCVTANKNGTAIITATVDGVSIKCKVMVIKPDITVDPSNLILRKGERKKIVAAVSSGNTPEFKSSNSNIVAVSSTGCVTGIEKGTAYITVSEDGSKAKCKIQVM